MTFRAFSIGFSAAVLALACGSDDSNNDKDTGDTNGDVVVAPPPVDVRPETCDDNPLLAGCPAQGGGPAVAPPPRPAQQDPGANETELARAAAENVLAANCGQCHGPALT